MRSPFICACVLFTLSQVSCKPFYWGDNSYYTTRQPLLKKAFSKLDHWFRNLIDAYPSSTWHWKEHFYGRTYWKDPKLLRGWLSITEKVLGHNYRECHRRKTNINPLGWPGVTRPKWNPDYIDDNILSIPNTEELEEIEAKAAAKKKRPEGDSDNDDEAKPEKKENTGNPREVGRAYDDEYYK